VFGCWGRFDSTLAREPPPRLRDTAVNVERAARRSRVQCMPYACTRAPGVSRMCVRRSQLRVFVGAYILLYITIGNVKCGASWAHRAVSTPLHMHFRSGSARVNSTCVRVYVMLYSCILSTGIVYVRNVCNAPTHVLHVSNHVNLRVQSPLEQSTSTPTDASSLL
jgi:hypothetical protein